MKRKNTRAGLVFFLALIAYFFSSLSLWREGEVHQTQLPKGNAESFFAMDRRYPFAEAGRYELELIPGIGDVHAGRLLEKQHDILACGKEKNVEESRSCFELVQGIGEKRSALLESYLSLE